MWRYNNREAMTIVGCPGKVLGLVSQFIPGGIRPLIRYRIVIASSGKVQLSNIIRRCLRTGTRVVNRFIDRLGQVLLPQTIAWLVWGNRNNLVTVLNINRLILSVCIRRCLGNISL